MTRRLIKQTVNPNVAGREDPGEWKPDSLRRRGLRAPRRMDGSEHRWLWPRRGLLKLLERGVDRFASRYVFPHLLGIWSPYSWLLPRRLEIAEASIEPPGWPAGLAPVRVLLLSDVHTGPFLRPSVLGAVLRTLMSLEPDLVAIAGDVVTGSADDLEGFAEEFAPLAAAPLGAWFCLGNHDHFSGEPERIAARLESVGIGLLRNRSVDLLHGGGTFRIGGIDDRVLGAPEWESLIEGGAPHVLLAHHPDDFYEAASRSVALVLSGHTHGGQIRFPNGPPIVRQSRFRFDEGLYQHRDAMLVVSRGLGAVGIPWRVGADPEAVLLTIRPRRPEP